MSVFGYALTLRHTKTGKLYVELGHWSDEWGARPYLENVRRISGFYPPEEKHGRMLTFCLRYAAEHPGCLTASEALDVHATLRNQREASE